MSETTTTLYRAILRQRFSEAKTAFDATMSAKVATALQREYRTVGRALSAEASTITEAEEPFVNGSSLFAKLSELSGLGKWVSIDAVVEKRLFADTYVALSQYILAPNAKTYRYDDGRGGLKHPETVVVEMPDGTIVVGSNGRADSLQLFERGKPGKLSAALRYIRAVSKL